MKLEVINEQEPIEITLEFINNNRNWDSKTENYILTKEEAKDHYNTPLNDCHIYQRGQYLIIEYKSIVHYWELTCNQYNFLESAIYYMQLDEPEEWKTLGRLIDFRMAIRQTEVNEMGYVETILQDRKKITFQTYKEFMRLARKHDLEHHGYNTF
ncbi:hypothetical protein PG593_03685 [Riemerella anatipestifer]|uniref:hypothetical protein n=1 Tax=Riemerella anatipestifer TaxID=34085 RepID=UPI00069ADFF1|nr:hypothetical protein [Riemerella anatipestifer]MDR7694125.1 hypothetical protein [Riemerella anatipestifer]MDY3528881.1 hypothetical protein [Riemerella anatipestifer]